MHSRRLSKINAVLCIPWYLVFKFTIPCCDGDEDSDEEDGDGDEEGGAKTDPKDDEEAGEKEEEEKQDQWEHWTWCIPKYWITFFMARPVPRVTLDHRMTSTATCHPVA